MSSLRSELVLLIDNPMPFLSAEDVVLRRMAITALTPEQAMAVHGELAVLASDEAPTVRSALAEKLGSCGTDALAILSRLQGDTDFTVREAVATAYGEIASSGSLPWLVLIASADPNRQVQEAAVASLGAIGDPQAVDPLLDLMANGPPQVRRRAVAAITVFDDDRVEAAIIRAAFDKNPGVREAAEMVVGRQLGDR